MLLELSNWRHGLRSSTQTSLQRQYFTPVSSSPDLLQPKKALESDHLIPPLIHSHLQASKSSTLRILFINGFWLVPIPTIVMMMIIRFPFLFNFTPWPGFVSYCRFDAFRMAENLKKDHISDKLSSSIASAMSIEFDKYNSSVLSKTGFEMERCRRDASLEIVKTQFISHQDGNFSVLKNLIENLGVKMDGKIENLGVKMDGKIENLGVRMDRKIEKLDGKIDSLVFRMDVLEKHLNLLSVIIGGGALLCGTVLAGVKAYETLILRF